MIKFSAFFQNWLYAQDGYYAKIPEIGKRGDFYTSVSASRFFGGCIANHLITQIKKGILPDRLAVCEIGAHKGYLMSDVISFICELQPNLLNNLEFAIVDKFTDSEKIKKQYPQRPIPNAAFVFANEIFDAFSCEIVDRNKMAFIDENGKKEDGKKKNCDMSLHFDVMNDETQEMATKYNLATGELALGYEEFAQNLAESFEVVEFLTFDYGEWEPRGDFSIRIYKDHKVYSLFEVGLKEFYKNSDITYDVNFSHLTTAFEEAGFKKISFSTQMMALIDFGLFELLEILQKNVSGEMYRHEINKIKTLISPQFLGERFKMVNFIKT